MEAAAATSCVCLTIHSGKRILMEIKMLLEPFMAWNINCMIAESIAITYSLKATTTEMHYLTIRLRVQCVMSPVVKQS